MDMKYDSAVMNKLVEATKSRLADAYNEFSRVMNLAQGVGTNNWDDKKKREFDGQLQEICKGLKHSFQQIDSYLKYLNQKMNELENGG